MGYRFFDEKNILMVIKSTNLLIDYLMELV